MAEHEIPPTSQLPAVAGMPNRELRETLNNTLIALGLAMFVFALYLLPSQWRTLSETAEARIAVTARNMIQNDDWMVPNHNDEIRLNKPPLPYWMVATSASLLGADEERRVVSVRATTLPSGIFGTACVFLVVLFGAHIFGRAAGIWAGIMLGLSFYFTKFSQFGTGEIILTFFTTSALVSAAWLACAPKPGFFSPLLLGLSLGLAILTKGPIPIFIVGGALGIEAIRCRTFNLRKVLFLGLAIAVAGAVAAPWYLSVQGEVSEASSRLFAELGDAIAGTSHDQDEWPFFYLIKILEALLPWTPLLLLAWPTVLLQKKFPPQAPSPMDRIPTRFASFFVGAFIFGIIGFTLIPKQQDYYLLPLIPVLLLASGRILSRLNQPGGYAEERIAWIQITSGIVGGILVAILPLLLELFDSSVLLPMSVSIPMGILIIVLSLAAARQWVEGNSSTAGLALGLVAYAMLAAYSMFFTLNNEKYDRFVKACPNLQNKIKNQPKDAQLYSMDTQINKSTMLYYLNWKKIYDLKELYGPDKEPDPTDGSEPPPRLLLCRQPLALQLGEPQSAEDYQILYLTSEKQHLLKEIRKALIERRKKEAAAREN